MFQVTASGTPRAAIEQLERQSSDNLVKGHPQEEQLRTKVIGFATDAIKSYDPLTNVVVTAWGGQDDKKRQSLSLNVHSITQN